MTLIWMTCTICGRECPKLRSVMVTCRRVACMNARNNVKRNSRRKARTPEQRAAYARMRKIKGH